MSSERVQQQNKVSLAMIVRNEARCLARCLRSVHHTVDEIVVVDTGSTDGTGEIACEYGARLHTFTWSDDFSAARNFALARTTGSWILVLDADETVSEPLAGEIKDFVRGPPQVGRLKIVSDFMRQGQQLRSQAFVSRLFPRGAFFEGKIHEQVVSSLPRVNLRGELWHDGYLENLKSERNVSLLQAEIALDPQRAYLHYQLALEFNSLNRAQQAFACLQEARAKMQPADEPFAPNVIVDFLYAAMECNAFAAGLEVIRIWDARLADFPDFHFVCGLFYTNLIRSDTRRYISELAQVERRFLRCLAIGETETYRSVRGTGSFLASYNLGLYYHLSGNVSGARNCLESAARAGYAPASEMLHKIVGT